MGSNWFAIVSNADYEVKFNFGNVPKVENVYNAMFIFVEPSFVMSGKMRRGLRNPALS